MKHIFKTIFPLGILLLVSGCVLDDIDTQMTDEQAIASIRLECDALESYTIPAERGKTISFRVKSTTPWTATVEPAVDWLTVTPVSSGDSSLSEDLTVKATPNEGFENRTANVVVKGENTDIKYTVAITQLRSGQLEVTPISGVFEKTGGELPFDILVNNDWAVSAADSWLTFDKNSGVSDGTPATVTVKAKAAVNKAINRETTVTVTSGELTETFSVQQNGETLEFTPVENPSVDRKGGSVTLGVNSTIDWKVECGEQSWTVEKLSATQVKVTAPWNNRLAPRKVNITLKPVAEDIGDVSSTLEVTQDSNVELKGNYEVLEDGSVKMSCAPSGTITRAYLKDESRYMDLTLTFGEKDFRASGQLWVQAQLGSVNIYNQLSLDGNKRIRTDGNHAGGASCYASSTFSITADALNAMETYHYKTTPQADPVKWDMLFEVNGKQIVTKSGPNPYYYDTGSAQYWFGFYSNTTDGTWYVIKSVDIIPVAE